MGTGRIAAARSLSRIAPIRYSKCARPGARRGEETKMAMRKDVRRVVTTVDKDGKAVVLFDDVDQHAKVRPHGTVTRLLWVADETPADMRGPADRAAREMGIAPPAGGSVFRIVEFPPTSKEVEALPLDYQHKIIGDHSPKRGLPPRHPMMHRTRSIDYAVIMSGEIDMLLDEGEVHFRAGDVLVQQGTNHAWVNRGTEPCRIAFILIDAQEP
jgi:mannose-6-phosphate isomerase-like protein (cupin superfamily)